MTIDQFQTLERVIDDALDANPNARGKDVVRWIKLHRRTVYDQHIETLGDEGLAERVRTRRKHRSPAKEIQASKNLCFDFGLPLLDLDTEISIPADPNNLLYGPADWREPDEVTVDDIDLHVALLRAQQQSTATKIDAWLLVRQAAVRVSPEGRTDIKLKVLREVARKRRGAA